jgi:molybdopterin converting factor small subunit
MPRIRFTNLLAERIGGVNEVDVPGATVDASLRALTAQHPSLTPLVWGKDGALNAVMVVFLNDRQLGAGELGTSVGSGDEIDIVSALEGG